MKKSIAQQWAEDQLEAVLLKQWADKFPDVSLGWGFNASLAEAPMIQRCLARNDPNEFVNWYKREVDRAHKIGEDW